jgi:hypothetical protein
MAAAIVDRATTATTTTIRPCYYAIRVCNSLKAPAIFLDWGDCSFYIDQEENETYVDYQMFAVMSQAVDYILKGANAHAKHSSSSAKSSATATQKTPQYVTPAGNKRAGNAIVSASNATIAESAAKETPKAKQRLDESSGDNSKNNYSSISSITETATITPTDDDPSRSTASIAVEDTQEETTWSLRKRAPVSRFKADDEPITPTTKKRRKCKWDGKFDELFEKLKQYKEKHGTAHVPSKVSEEDFQELARWVPHCRKHAKLYRSDPTSTDYIQKTRYEALMQVGFVVQPSPRRSLALSEKVRQKQQAHFEEMFRQLQDFHRQHGHVNSIPRTPETNPLRNWADQIRRNYQKLQLKQFTTLTIDQIGQLARLGFPLVAKVRRRSWEERAQAWLAFHTEHGRDPTQTENRDITKFIWQMRTKYKRKQQTDDGQPSISTGTTNLTQAQIDQLTSWGFQWESHYKTPNRLNYMSWEDRYQQLLDYKEEFGDCLVPQAYPDVGSWVHQQRIHYKRFVEGKACVLNEDKIKKLKDAGFVFLTRHRSKPKGYDDGNDDDDLRQLPNHLKTAQGGAQGNCSSESSDDDDDETRRNRLVFEATQPHQETTFAPRVPRHRHV